MQNSVKDIILNQRDLGKALRAFKDDMDRANPRLAAALDDIESDYRRMCAFLFTGGKDPKLEELYDNLLRRAYCLLCSVEVARKWQGNAAGAAAAEQMYAYTARYEAVRSHLETYVQEQALATLLPEEEQKKSIAAANKSHQQYVSRLFDLLTVSDAWTDSVTAFTVEMLLSPTIDTNDVLQLVSAITLSLLNVFDVNKWLALAGVFEKAADERVRQRAFVGWALSLPGEDMGLFPEVGETIRRLCEDSSVSRALAELQIQVYYCDNAEADSAKIEEEILPTLKKNNRFRITKSGIEEMEEDELADILDPGAEERSVEEMERAIHRVAEMQLAGSDIHFKGFSQMKRYPFFNELCNWFCPFYIEHPALSAISEELRQLPMIKALLETNMFCDSDCYSFAFILTSLFSHMPPSLKEMMGSGEHAFVAMGTGLNNRSAVYVRRMYLQDMYRFFRLNYRRGEFASPFSSGGNGRAALFLSNRLLAGALSDGDVAQLYNYLYKNKRFAEILLMDEARHCRRSNDLEKIVAMSHLKSRHYTEASRIFRHILAREPENEQAMKGMAQMAFANGKYKEAVEYYERLAAVRPEKTFYQLNRAVSLIRSGRVEDGMAPLFKLEYDNPDDKRVKRIIAWGYLMRGEAQKADDIYTVLLSDEAADSTDCLNAAYAKWALSDNKEAARLFGKYMKDTFGGTDKQALYHDIMSEKSLLQSYGISETECKVMTDMV